MKRELNKEQLEVKEKLNQHEKNAKELLFKTTSKMKDKITGNFQMPDIYDEIYKDVENEKDFERGMAIIMASEGAIRYIRNMDTKRTCMYQ